MHRIFKCLKMIENNFQRASGGVLESWGKLVCSEYMDTQSSLQFAEPMPKQATILYLIAWLVGKSLLLVEEEDVLRGLEQYLCTAEVPLVCTHLKPLCNTV